MPTRLFSRTSANSPSVEELEAQFSSSELFHDFEEIGAIAATFEKSVYDGPVRDRSDVSAQIIYAQGKTGRIDASLSYEDESWRIQEITITR